MDKRLDYLKKKNETPNDYLTEARQTLDKIPPELKANIYSNITPEALYHMGKYVTNYDMWNIYRMKTKNVSPWDDNIDWIQYILPSDYFYVRNNVMIGSINDILGSGSWFHAPGLYKFHSYDGGGVWLATPHDDLSELKLITIEKPSKDMLIGLGGTWKGQIMDDDSKRAGNIKKILKETSKMLKIEPFGDKSQGILLHNDHEYPLLFYLTELPNDANIYLKHPIRRSSVVIWKVISEKTMQPIGRAIGNNHLYKMDIMHDQDGVGIGILGVDNKIRAFGNWNLT